MFQGSLKGVLRKRKGCLRNFQECFKEVSGKYQACFKKVSWVFQQILKGISSSFEGVSRVFERSLKGALGKLQWCFRKFQRSFKKLSRVFKKSFKGVSMKIKGCCNVVLSLFQVGSNWVLKVIDRSSKTILVVSRKFQGSSKEGFRMFKGRFKSVPMKF